MKFNYLETLPDLLFRSRFRTGGIVPTAAMIHEARKRRQRARELGDAADVVSVPEERGKDYIAFGNRKREQTRPESEERENHSLQSRLVREEDHDKDDDEDGGVASDVIKFSYNRVETEKEKRREMFLEVEVEDGGSDGEAERWEAEQIRKGFGSSNQFDLMRSTAAANAAERGHFSDWAAPSSTLAYDEARPYLKANSILGEASFKSLSSLGDGDLTCQAIRTRIKNK